MLIIISLMSILIFLLVSSVNGLKIGKASGPDGILSELIKSNIHEITPILLPLYNRILCTGQFPAARPLFKSGSLTDPNNLRGIFLIDVINKILTGMMHSRLYEWAEKNNKIDEAEAGLRKGYSTTDNLFVLMSMVQKHLSKKGGGFYFIFIDFTKAFDNVDHIEFIECLKRKGVNGFFLKVLISMFLCKIR